MRKPQDIPFFLVFAGFRAGMDRPSAGVLLLPGAMNPGGRFFMADAPMFSQKTFLSTDPEFDGCFNLLDRWLLALAQHETADRARGESLHSGRFDLSRSFMGKIPSPAHPGHGAFFEAILASQDEHCTDQARCFLEAGPFLLNPERSIPCPFAPLGSPEKIPGWIGSVLEADGLLPPGAHPDLDPRRV